MIVLRFPMVFTMGKCYINGKERDGFVLICKLAEEETYLFKLSINILLQVAGHRPGSICHPHGVAQETTLPLVQHTLPVLSGPGTEGRGQRMLC